MSFTLLSFVFLIVVIWSVALATLFGYRSGLMNSALKLAINVAAAFLAAISSAALASSNKYEILELFADNEMVQMIYQNSSPFGEVIDALVCVFFAACIYIPTFITICLAARFIIFVVRESKKPSSTDESHSSFLPENASFLDKNDKKIGAAIGAVSGFVIATAFLSPVVGCVSVLADLADTVISFREEDAEYELELDTEALDVLDECSNDFMLITLDVMGSGNIFDITTSTFEGGRMTSISSQIETLKGLDLKKTIEALGNIGEGDEEGLEQIERFIDALDEMPLIEAATAAAMKDMTDTWLAGGDYYEIPRPVLSDNSAVNRFVDEVLRVFGSSDIRTIQDDLGTLIGLTRILNEHAHLLETDDYEELADAFSQSGLIDALKDEISKNPHMVTVSAAIDDIVMQAVSEEISDLLKYTDSERTELYQNIAELLTDTSDLSLETRTDYVCDEISTIFDNYGLYAPDDVTRQVVTMFISQIKSENGTVTEYDVGNYINSFLGRN